MQFAHALVAFVLERMVWTYEITFWRFIEPRHFWDCIGVVSSNKSPYLILAISNLCVSLVISKTYMAAWHLTHNFCHFSVQLKVINLVQESPPHMFLALIPRKKALLQLMRNIETHSNSWWSVNHTFSTQTRTEKYLPWYFISCLSERGIPRFASEWKTLSFTSVHRRLPV